MEKIKELFKEDKFANLCGIQLIEVRPGYAKCTMKVTENHLNGIGVLMGGAIFTLADFSFSVAANSYGGVAVLLNASINYLKKCDHGEITAIASEISRTHKIGVYRVSVTDEINQQIAEFTGTSYLKETQS